MAEYRGFDFLDYLLFLVKRKKILLIVFISSLLISYLTIYFFIPPEYESTAVIIPSGDSQMGALSGIVKDLKSLPLGLGGSSISAETDLYLTVINSRRTLEKIVKKFKLKEDYNLESIEKAIKALKNRITAKVTDENALEIVVRAHSAQKSADIVNYLLDILNETIIELNVSKSRENREFLEQRYAEIKLNLRLAEDSLQIYQLKSGMLEIKEQPKIILNAFSKLENEILAKQIELSIMEKISESETPQIQMLRAQIEIFQKEFDTLNKNDGNESILLPFKSIPEKTKSYIRLYRNVEIYNTILEFIVPLYEQAKFEEQKNIPVLQVIDYGVVPEKRSYPSRVLFSIIASTIILLFVISILFLRAFLKNSNNPKLKSVFKEVRIKETNNS